MKLTFYQHLVLGLRINRVIPPLPMCLLGIYSDNFALTVYLIIVMKCLQIWLIIS